MEMQTGVQFGTTRWTILEALQQGSPDQARDATESLISTYWPAVYGYLRRSGHRRELAAEITQAFFVDVVLGRKLFEVADPAAGRLRSLLLTALKNYRIDLARHEKIERRVGGEFSAVMDIVEARRPQDETLSPDAVYEREWALSLLQEAVQRCEDHFIATDRESHWRLFEARYLKPHVRPQAAPSLETAASEFGFESATAAASAMQVVRQRLKAVLSDVVAMTEGEQTEQGVRQIFDVLG